MNNLPNSYGTDVLTSPQLDWLAKRLPEPAEYTGRPAYSNTVLLPGILKLLRAGCRWRDLDIPGFPSGVTHWRRLRFWEQKSRLSRLWRVILSALFHSGLIDLSRTALDGTLVSSYSFHQKTGYSGKHHRTGTKVSCLTDAQGIPLACVLASGNRHDAPLALPTINRLKIGQRTRPMMILADKGYDGADLRRTLRHRGIRTNIPTRQFQRRRKRGRPPRYDQTLGKQRFVVERTNSWFKSFRRIHFRYDVTIASFRAFVLLAYLVIGVRKLIG